MELKMSRNQSESQLQSKIIKNARAQGVYIYKNAQNIYTERGRPDLTACVPTTTSKLLQMFGPDFKIGVFVGLELKREGHLNEVSDAQQIVGRQIQDAGGFWFAIDDADIVDALIRRFSNDV